MNNMSYRRARRIEFSQPTWVLRNSRPVSSYLEDGFSIFTHTNSFATTYSSPFIVRLDELCHLSKFGDAIKIHAVYCAFSLSPNMRDIMKNSCRKEIFGF
ncbi:hypothetical protein CDAR_512541 [Caerostris darwini]|uniref:Uncharacterized protein n=1 Tax=Caerostris darwini TaxID=1538125 RepID=A0AAV4SZP8_9ARAC|nr:hypothetical protein CDAR_570901 [Caerostris darwini]GIY38501.1 hypothetical protein CDAR_512541 [Caerostris darwini]